jgi:hypothetical protein
MALLFTGASLGLDATHLQIMLPSKLLPRIFQPGSTTLAGESAI